VARRSSCSRRGSAPPGTGDQTVRSLARSDSRVPTILHVAFTGSTPSPTSAGANESGRDAEALCDERVKHGRERRQDARLARVHQHPKRSPDGEAPLVCPLSTGPSLFWRMFQHVINHATYHRGQVTMMLRQLGANQSARISSGSTGIVNDSLKMALPGALLRRALASTWRAL
jgi:hypothetical protein